MSRPERPGYIFKLELYIRARLQEETCCSLAIFKPMCDIQQDFSKVLPSVPPLKYCLLIFS